MTDTQPHWFVWCNSSKGLCDCGLPKDDPIHIPMPAQTANPSIVGMDGQPPSIPTETREPEIPRAKTYTMYVRPQDMTAYEAREMVAQLFEELVYTRERIARSETRERVLEDALEFSRKVFTAILSDLEEKKEPAVVPGLLRIANQKIDAALERKG